jgi:hypothetical protein
MMWITGKINIANSQNSVRKKSFGGTFYFSNCYIIGLDTGSLVLIVYGCKCEGPPPPFFSGPAHIQFHCDKRDLVPFRKALIM